MPPSEQLGPAAGVLARGYAFVVVGLRYLIVAAWAAVAVLAILFLPPLNATSDGLADLIPPGSAAAHAESDAARLFGFPIDAAVAIVQRDPHGMPAATRDRAIRQAIAVDRQVSGQPGQLATAAAALAQAGQPDAAQVLSGPVSPGPPGGIADLAGAFPLPNTPGLLPGTKEQSTTVITFLYFRPGTAFGVQTAGAGAYVHWFLNRPADDVVGVTGPVPAEYDQSQIIGKDLEWVELLTVVAIALIVGLRFRSVGAPLATLTCAAAAYVIAVRVVAWLAQRMGVTLPPDLDPVLVVLLLGVSTDYTVFFLDGMRARLAGGEPRVRADRRFHRLGPRRPGAHRAGDHAGDAGAAGAVPGGSARPGSHRPDRDGHLDDPGSRAHGDIRRPAAPACSCWPPASWPCSPPWA